MSFTGEIYYDLLNYSSEFCICFILGRPTGLAPEVDCTQTPNDPLCETATIPEGEQQQPQVEEEKPQSEEDQSSDGNNNN